MKFFIKLVFLGVLIGSIFGLSIAGTIRQTENTAKTVKVKVKTVKVKAKTKTVKIKAKTIKVKAKTKTIKVKAKTKTVKINQKTLKKIQNLGNETEEVFSFINETIFIPKRKQILPAKAVKAFNAISKEERFFMWGIYYSEGFRAPFIKKYKIRNPFNMSYAFGTYLKRWTSKKISEMTFSELKKAQKKIVSFEKADRKSLRKKIKKVTLSKMKGKVKKLAKLKKQLKRIRTAAPVGGGNFNQQGVKECQNVFGFSDDTIFTPAVQEVCMSLKFRYIGIQKMKKGRRSVKEVAKPASTTWAGLPHGKKSYYKGQHAGISYSVLIDFLTLIKNEG